MAAGGESGSVVERRALRASLWAAAGFAVISVVWGLIADSEVILLDAIFTPIDLLVASGSLVVSRIVAKGPTRMFPFGRNALAPLFVLAQAVILAGGLAYAALDAIRVIVAGGYPPAGASLVGYGAFSAVTGLIMWRMLSRMAGGSPLVRADADGWLSSVVSSAVIAAAGVIVLLTDGTRFAAAAPYVDPALVIIGSLAFAVIPVRLFRRSVRDLQIARPEPELAARVESVVETVSTAEGLPEPVLRVGRTGSIMDVALVFVLPEGTGDIACQDRVRRAVRGGLADLPCSMWVTVEFSYDAGLFEATP